MKMTKEQECGNESKPRSGIKKERREVSDDKRHGSVGMDELRGNACVHRVQGQAERNMRTTKAIAEHVDVTCGGEM